jgi:hypothetical protein
MFENKLNKVNNISYSNGEYYPMSLYDIHKEKNYEGKDSIIFCNYGDRCFGNIIWNKANNQYHFIPRKDALISFPPLILKCIADLCEDMTRQTTILNNI